MSFRGADRLSVRTDFGFGFDLAVEEEREAVGVDKNVEGEGDEGSVNWRR